MIGGLVFMFRLSWQMTLITFIVLPLITVVSKAYGSYYDVRFHNTALLCKFMRTEIERKSANYARPIERGRRRGTIDNAYCTKFCE